MKTEINLDQIYALSEGIVTREIQGELIIMPITSEVVDLEGAIFTLNETGRAIWGKLDSRKTLKEIVNLLSLEFKASADRIEKDVIGLVKELLKRKLLVEVKKN